LDSNFFVGPISDILNGSTTNNYFLVDPPSGGCANPHVTEFSTGIVQSTVAIGNVAECTDELMVDSGEIWQGGANGGSYTDSYNLVLPNAAGYSWAEMASLVFPGAIFSFNHNTFYGVYAGSSAGNGQFGIADLEENTTLATGTVPSFASNILYNPGTTASGLHGAYFVRAVTYSTLDVMTPAGADFNDDFNGESLETSCPGSCTNQGKGYIGSFSIAPGVHDLAVDPQFIDYQRVFALFDQKYLKKPVATAWSGLATYHIGDIVSNVVSGVYWNLPINYRYIDGPGCSEGNPQPGELDDSGSWRPCWEWASLFWLRSDLGANYNAITDSSLTVNNDTSCTSGCSIIHAAGNFAKLGYTPTNAALSASSANTSDSLDIGAVSFKDLTPPTSTILSPSSGETVSGTVTISVSSTDDVAVSGVQFLIDGSDLGSLITATSAPSTYSISWDTTSLSNGLHTIGIISKDSSNNTSTLSISVTVHNVAVIAPSSGGGSSGGGGGGYLASSAAAVILNIPINDTVVSGTIILQASINPQSTIASGNFFWDGIASGSFVINPLSNVATAIFNTQLLTDGIHTLTASLFNSNGYAAVSPSVVVAIANNTSSTAFTFAPANAPPPFPSSPSATKVSTSSLQSELDFLFAELASLEARAGLAPGETTALAPGYVFTANLRLYDTGSDVHQLQLLLIREAKGPAAQKLKTHGSTDTFGMLTFNALVEYQKSVGITPTSGFFGPITRGWVNGL
jgi:hypothetical protein